MRLNKFVFLNLTILLLLGCAEKKPSPTQESGPTTPENMPSKVESDGSIVSDNNNSTSIAEQTRNKDISCWVGMIDSKIPVRLCYQRFEEVLVGEIWYPNSKDPSSIPIIGEITNENYVELREFNNKGMITGHIAGIPLEKEFNPEWFNPANQRMRMMKLTSLDTFVQIYTIDAEVKSLKGTYHYAFGPKGYSGDLEVLNAAESKVEVRMLSTTGDLAGYNIAELPQASGKLNKNIAKIKYPYNEACEITIYFFKQFARVKEDNCNGEFGHNATLQGIYFKTTK